jgi:hypothetical protein
MDQLPDGGVRGGRALTFGRPVPDRALGTLLESQTVAGEAAS